MSKIMLRQFKNLFGWFIGLALVHSAAAFTVWGPLEAWQTPDLNYGPRAIGGGVENGGSKVLGAGSRVGVPVITYGFDETFTEFFGAEGIAAVDQAMAIVNGLPAASAASPNLTEFVTEGNQQINYTAEALGLFDLKSSVLNLMMEHLGLLGEDHVYDLSLREPIPNTPPCTFEYFVINRNYDPITYLPSTFVNGVQYGYNIEDGCPVISVGDAIEYPKDKAVNPEFYFTAVATSEAQVDGGYYMSISRDDFGGLRWLYRRNHLVSESIDPNSFITAQGSSAFGLGGFLGVTNSAANISYFGGVEKVRFLKIPVSMFNGTLANPVSYNYSKLAIVNGKQTTVQFTRIIAAPDIIFSTADLVVRSSPVLIPPVLSRNANFVAPPTASQGGGPLPNVISPVQLVVFNNALPITINSDPNFLSDVKTDETLEAWGSFGASSAPPIVYPNGASIIELENEILAGQDTSTIPGQTTGAFNPFGFVGVGTVTFLGNY